jgi:hypothetical protein
VFSVVQKTSELYMMRDDLAVVNRELLEEIGQLKAELTTVLAEKNQADLDLQALRSVQFSYQSPNSSTSGNVDDTFL